MNYLSAYVYTNPVILPLIGIFVYTEWIPYPDNVSTLGWSLRFCSMLCSLYMLFIEVIPGNVKEFSGLYFILMFSAGLEYAHRPLERRPTG